MTGDPDFVGTDRFKSDTQPLGWGRLFVTCSRPNSSINGMNLHMEVGLDTGTDKGGWSRHAPLSGRVSTTGKILFSARRELNLDRTHKTKTKNVRRPRFSEYGSGQLLSKIPS